MKNLILILTLLAFITACDNDEKTIQEPEKETSMEHLYETKWQVAELNGNAVTIENEEWEQPYLVLRLEENQIFGHGGCNRFFGSFKLDGDAIGFSGVGATKMYCQDTMDIEEAFFKTLQDVTGYELSDDALHLKNADGDVIIRLGKS